MRIAHVITRMIVGGAQENTFLTCAGLVAQDHDVTLFSGPETGPEGSLWDQAQSSGATLVRVDSLRRNVSVINDLRCVRALTQHFRRGDFDVVHTHSSKAGILGRWAAHRAGVPHIVHTIHGMSFNRTQPWPIRTLYAALERWAARWTESFVCVADAMTAQAVVAGIAPRDRFVTIRSGIRTAQFAPDAIARKTVRASWHFDPDAVVFGTVARLFRNKGYESLLQAMPEVVRRCPRARFVWIGDGKDRSRYMADLERLGLRERVHLTGLVPPEEIPSLLNGIDVLVHASQWEGLARALVQASLTEKPVVSFDNDGAPEIVEHEVTGLLVPLGDTSGLAEAMIALGTDETRRREMGVAARCGCVERFDDGVMVAQLAELYGRLIGSAGSAGPAGLTGSTEAGQSTGRNSKAP